MPADWLAERRTEVAADRILDAADELFTRQDAATVGMNEIARAAGCSRATVYRYFENRDALYTAYVHRETLRVFSATGPTHRRYRRSAPSACLEGVARCTASGPREPGPLIMVRLGPASDRRRDGRTLRCDQGTDGGFLRVVGDR